MADLSIRQARRTPIRDPPEFTLSLRRYFSSPYKGGARGGWMHYLKLKQFTFFKRESTLVVMSEIDDSFYDGDESERWWEDQAPEEIPDTRYRVLVKIHEHGLTGEVIESAGIGAVGFNPEEIHFPPGVDKSDLSPGAIVLELHPEKDSIQIFPGGEYDYLRYADSAGFIVRMVLSDDMLGVVGGTVPYTDRNTLGASEAEEIDEQLAILHERMDNYYETLGETASDGDDSVDLPDYSPPTDEEWVAFSEDPQKYRKDP